MWVSKVQGLRSLKLLVWSEQPRHKASQQQHENPSHCSGCDMNRFAVPLCVRGGGGEAVSSQTDSNEAASLCVLYVTVCADAGAALENGEQEAHGVQKPGKEKQFPQFHLLSVTLLKLPGSPHQPLPAFFSFLFFISFLSSTSVWFCMIFSVKDSFYYYFCIIILERVSMWCRV